MTKQNDMYANATRATEAIQQDMAKRKAGRAHIVKVDQSGKVVFITLSNGVILVVDVINVA